jgi:hypothetical protein
MSNQERVAERRKRWGELIARRQQSGNTVKGFCVENGVGGPSFYAWRKRLKGKIQPVGFALVETAAVGQQRGQAMELILSPANAFRSARGHNDGHSDRTGFLIQRGPWGWAKICGYGTLSKTRTLRLAVPERQPAATYHRYVLPRSSHPRPLNYKNWRSRAENPT